VNGDYRALTAAFDLPQRCAAWRGTVGTNRYKSSHGENCFVPGVGVKYGKKQDVTKYLVVVGRKLYYFVTRNCRTLEQSLN